MSMSNEFSTASRGTSANQHVDAVILTAVKLEFEALLEVSDGGDSSGWIRQDSLGAFEVATRHFRCGDGQFLRIAAAYSAGMGTIATADSAASLIHELRPRCLGMSGVCAGRRGEVELGDVIIGDRLWTYDTGSVLVEHDESDRPSTVFKSDPLTYNLPANWKKKAEFFQVEPTAPWLANRPRPMADQERWLMLQIFNGEDATLHPERRTCCADFGSVIQKLRKRGLLATSGLQLTVAGRAQIVDEMLLNPDGFPPQKPFVVHVGPIGTGTQVVRDEEIFSKLSVQMRKVLGLEMEAAAIGAVAHRHDALPSIVVKAVMDYADPEKNDNFKHFAARASAEVLIAFLRQNMKTATASEPEDEARVCSISDLDSGSDSGHFVGRDREIDSLLKWLKMPSPRAHLLRGLGGQGKTELGFRFALRAIEASRFSVVAVSLSSSEGVEQAIERIASILGMSQTAKSTQNSDYIVDVCRRNDTLLFIDGLEFALTEQRASLDGTIASDVFRSLMRRLLDHGSKARVLMTSRLGLVGLNTVGPLTSDSLAPLSSESGVALMRKLGATDQESLLQKLSETFEGHPLTLTVLPRLLRERRADDLASIKSALPIEKKIRQVLYRYKDSLPPSSLAVLRLTCIFRRAPAIWEFKAVASKLFSHGALEQLDRDLAECGELLQRDGSSRLSLHPTVREVFRDQWQKADSKAFRRAQRATAEYFEAITVNLLSEAPARSVVELAPAFDAFYGFMEINEPAIAHGLRIRYIDRTTSRDPTQPALEGSHHLIDVLGAWEAWRDLHCAYFLDISKRVCRPFLGEYDRNVLLYNVALAEHTLGADAHALVCANDSARGFERWLREVSNGVPRDDVALTFATLGASRVYALRSDIFASLGRISDAADEAARDLLFWDKTVRGYFPPTSPMDAPISECMTGIAKVQLLQGDFLEALETFKKATELHCSWSEYAFLHGSEGRTYVECLLACDQVMNLTEAKELHQRNFEYCEANDPGEALAYLQLQRATLERLSNDSAKALKSIEELRADVIQMDALKLRLEFHLEAARIHLSLDDAPSAMREMADAMERLSRRNHLLFRCDCLLMQSEIEQAMGNPMSGFDEASSIVASCGYGRRRRDIDLLRAGGRPSIAYGI